MYVGKNRTEPVSTNIHSTGVRHSNVFRGQADLVNHSEKGAEHFAIRILSPVVFRSSGFPKTSQRWMLMSTLSILNVGN